MSFGYWILRDKKIVKVDLMTWVRWFGDHSNRIIVKDDISGCQVSTIFLGIDHSFSMDSNPVLWETMVFGDGLSDLDMDRCGGSYEQAMEMHDRMCARVREALGIEPQKKVSNGSSSEAPT